MRKPTGSTPKSTPAPFVARRFLNVFLRINTQNKGTEEEPNPGEAPIWRCVAPGGGLVGWPLAVLKAPCPR